MADRRTLKVIGLWLGGMTYVLLVGCILIWVFWNQRWFAAVLLSIVTLYVLAVAMVNYALGHPKVSELRALVNAVSCAFLGAVLVVLHWPAGPAGFAEVARSDPLRYSVVLGLPLLALLSGLLEPLITGGRR